jgi:uncharacterized protein involved in exopolysaccharide biosynthesis
MDRKSYDWDEACAAAILETDRSKLKSRIEAAQAAINRRLEEMKADHSDTAAERFAIETAQAVLDALRRHDP